MLEVIISKINLKHGKIQTQLDSIKFDSELAIRSIVCNKSIQNIMSYRRISAAKIKDKIMLQQNSHHRPLKRLKKAATKMALLQSVNFQS